MSDAVSGPDEQQAAEPNKPCGTLFVHARWQTWQRKPLLADEDIAQAAQTALVTRTRELRCRTLAVGFMPDHVHAVFAFPASLPLSKLAQVATDASARAVARALSLSRPSQVADGDVWDRRFGLHTVGPESLDDAVSYVTEQAERHRTGDLRPHWEDAAHESTAIGTPRPRRQSRVPEV